MYGVVKKKVEKQDLKKLQTHHSKTFSDTPSVKHNHCLIVWTSYRHCIIMGHFKDSLQIYTARPSAFLCMN